MNNFTCTHECHMEDCLSLLTLTLLCGVAVCIGKKNINNNLTNNNKKNHNNKQEVINDPHLVRIVKAHKYG